jgi:hypothetical protein
MRIRLAMHKSMPFSLTAVNKYFKMHRHCISFWFTRACYSLELCSVLYIVAVGNNESSLSIVHTKYKWLAVNHWTTPDELDFMINIYRYKTYEEFQLCLSLCICSFQLIFTSFIWWHSFIIELNLR